MNVTGWGMGAAGPWGIWICFEDREGRQCGGFPGVDILYYACAMLDLVRLKVTSKRVDVKGICHVRFFLGLAELSSVSHGAGEIHSSCRFID